MRKIILNLALSLDGFIEGPNGEYDWCIMEPEMGFDRFLNEVDAIFFGRKSYELFGSQDPSTFSTDDERNLFGQINTKSKYVFSSTMESTGNDSVLISKNFEKAVLEIKEQEGKNIWLFGGAQLVTSFIKANLIDEYQLFVHPVVLGAGKPLFADLDKRLTMQLLKTEVYPSGVVGLFYTAP